eukprot:4110681-Amphidinium_carterae.2
MGMAMAIFSSLNSTCDRFLVQYRHALASFSLQTISPLDSAGLGGVLSHHSNVQLLYMLERRMFNKQCMILGKQMVQVVLVSETFSEELTMWCRLANYIELLVHEAGLWRGGSDTVNEQANGVRILRASIQVQQYAHHTVAEPGTDLHSLFIQ